VGQGRIPDILQRHEARGEIGHRPAEEKACAERSEVDLDAGDRPAIGDIDIAGMQAGNEAADPLIHNWRPVEGDPERVG